jgi:ATP-dependent DNA helicase 2 subunit 1
MCTLLKTRPTEITKGQGAEIKKGTFLYQPISLLSAPKVLELAQLLEGLCCTPSICCYISSDRNYEACQEDPDELRKTFPSSESGRVPMGDVFTSCNWVLRDGSVECPGLTRKLIVKVL